MTQADMRELLANDMHAAAHALLGWKIVFGNLSAQIVEVEAYSGDEPGCHAFRGMTPRTKVLFGPAGISYVYFTYGNHWMLNISALPDGIAGAILIRGAKPLTGLETMRGRRLKAKDDFGLLSGPGKIAAAFGLTGVHDSHDLLDGKGELQFIPGDSVTRVLAGTRIGLTPGKGDELPWRYIDAVEEAWASKPRIK
jgi:DNA-3-methyladenine glycosylase